MYSSGQGGLLSHPCWFKVTHDVEICSGTIFMHLLTKKMCCTTFLHQILPEGEIYHNGSAQISAPLPGNRSQSTSQHYRLGLTHYGACLMTDNASSRSKVANSFSHRGYNTRLHTYWGLSGNLTSWGRLRSAKGPNVVPWVETIPRDAHGETWVKKSMKYLPWMLKKNPTILQFMEVDGSGGYEHRHVRYLFAHHSLRESFHHMLA